MKQLLTKAVVLAVAVVVLATAFPTPAKADVSFGFSYTQLSPYGSWHVSAQHGRVWHPRIAVGEWHPYYDGHWVYTDLGWTWVSDYQWGGLPYHYGTWVIEPGIGWVWIPGTVWAPSWVVFCDGPDYIGWAPVPPRYSVGVSIGFGDIGYNHFAFVRSGDFMSHRIRSSVVPYSRNRVIINNTRIVNRISIENNIVINRGPDVRVVERRSGQRVRPVPIERVERVGPGRRFDRDELRVRPEKGRRPRVAEPVSARTPLPPLGDRDRDGDRNNGRRGDQDRDRDRYDRPRGSQDRERSSTEPVRRDERSTTPARRQELPEQPSARGPARQEEGRRPSAAPTQRQQPKPAMPSARQPAKRDEVNRPSAAPTQKRSPQPAQKPTTKGKAKSKKPTDKKDES